MTDVATTPDTTPDTAVTQSPQPGITPEQWRVLMRPLNKSRVAKRSQGGKQLSYLEAWDVKAHLTRVFGFGNWDSEVLTYSHVATREYESTGERKTPMVEVVYSAQVRLTVRDHLGLTLCTHTEVAVGSTSGPAHMLGEHHDNAVKTAASDALKRCAINLGTQYGLSLYNDGSTNDVIKDTLVKPDGVEALETKPTDEQVAALEKSLGAVVVQSDQEATT